MTVFVRLTIIHFRNVRSVVPVWPLQLSTLLRRWWCIKIYCSGSWCITFCSISFYTVAQWSILNVMKNVKSLPQIRFISVSQQDFQLWSWTAQWGETEEFQLWGYSSRPGNPIYCWKGNAPESSKWKGSTVLQKGKAGEEGLFWESRSKAGPRTHF